jgi:hypothetical protein
MRSKFTLGVGTAAAVALMVPAGGAAGAGSGLTFGRFAENITVNVVYVGIPEADKIAVEDLPAESSPVIRSRLFYPDTAPEDLDLGLDYSITYKPVFADTAFAGELEAFLVSDAARPTVETPGVVADTVTLFQEQYNGQDNATKEITENRWIDAPSTEQWLVDNAGDLGVDPSDPTVFLMDVSTIGNHVYVMTDTEDPDTGYDFGEIRASRKMTSWGGTPAGPGEDPARVWFYDLSAGPEGWSDNWNVDDADLDGDDEPDYRIPPIWHYQGLPRSYVHPGDVKATLSEDLGKVVRYVAVNQLFASSPLYPPFFTPNRIPRTVELDLNVVEWWNNVDVSATYVKPGFIQDSVGDLPAGPQVSVTQKVQDLRYSNDWARCYQGFSKDNKICYNDLTRGVYAPFANLFLASARNQRSFLDGGADYEAALVGFGVGNKPKNPQGLLGFADDNWLNGTQSGVFNFVYPDAVAVGYGMTTTMIHEYGHHSSLSHPHDGYDPATRADYGPGGATQFAWLGDMSHTIMSYMDLATDFGQFDRDNSARHHAAGYAKVAKAIAAQLPAATPAADALLGQAQEALSAHDYETMLTKAKEAYEAVVAAADAKGVPVTIQQPSTWTLAGPIKPGNGSRADQRDYATDLDSQHNVKRMYSK